MQLSRTATSQASRERRGTTGEPARYDTIGKKKEKKKKKILYPTVSTRRSSAELFSISAQRFSVLVYRIISSKCNHNSKPTMFGLAVRTCGNLLRRLPSAVATREVLCAVSLLTAQTRVLLGRFAGTRRNPKHAHLTAATTRLEKMPKQ